MPGIKENDADSWEPIKQWLLKLRRLKIAVVLIRYGGTSFIGESVRRRIPHVEV